MVDDTAQLPVSRLREVLALLVTNPLAAADKLDELADELHRQADAIRSRAEDPFKVQDGMADRVKMKVQGRDGETKQYIDTGVDI
jgi:hypothetical protein